MAALAFPSYADVTIHRDRWGVPHVTARTDAGCVYGLMFAQAEDHFAQLEMDTIRALGRSAEVDGERGVASDTRIRTFEIVRQAQEAYRTSSPALRRLAEAYADGLNGYLRRHPDVRPRLLTKFEPWYFMAFVDLPGNVDGVSLGGRFFEPSPDTGSNAWALAPSRTTAGRAILFLNPHVGLFGSDQRYECHLESGEGWRISGFAILGQPIPHSGHNGRLGWTQTNSGADRADAYRIALDGTDHYRFGTERRAIATWSETLRVGSETRTLTFRKTHHGPLVRPEVAVRFPIDRAVRQWQQKYAMGRARNLREFRRALAMGCLTYSNTTYADADGNIGFWYGNVVPRRDPSLDWTRPVDGSDPRTEWRGFHSPDELPHVINPRGGFVQNGNSDPWGTTVGDNPDPRRFPAYIGRDVDTSRARNMRRILTSKPRFTFAEQERLAFDTYALTAAERLPGLFEAAAGKPDLAEPLAVLRAWDRRLDIHSVGATLYVRAEEELGPVRRGPVGTPTELVDGLRRAVARLERDWGTWRVPYGLVNRMQRRQPFDPLAPSLPVAGGPSAFGQVFAFSGPTVGRQRFGNVGNTYVGLVEFGPRVRARSVNGFGQSGDPASPHYFDQAPLYAAGRFKDAWFDMRDVVANLERKYRPAE
ncbi:MAG: penicillin acylase family protein [Fimbriimonas sp.]